MRVGTGIGQDFDLEAANPAVSIASHRDLGPTAATVWAHSQVLATSLNPFHRAAQLKSDSRNHHVFGVELSLLTESAAHIWDAHPEFVFIHTQAAR
jgi:hypothetical protein